MRVIKRTTDWSLPIAKGLYTNQYTYFWGELLDLLKEAGVGVDVTPTFSGDKIERVSAQVSFGGAPSIRFDNTSSSSYSVAYFWDVNGEGFTIGSYNKSDSNQLTGVTHEVSEMMVVVGNTSCVVFYSSSSLSLQNSFQFIISKTSVGGEVATVINGLHHKLSTLVGTLSTGVLRVTHAPINVNTMTSDSRVLIKCIDGLGVTGTLATSITLSSRFIAEYFGTVVDDVFWMLLPPKGMSVIPYSIINIDGIGYIVRGEVGSDSGMEKAYYLWKIG